MTDDNQRRQVGQQPVSFLFLASHGLLSPIASIRWGCSRLLRTDQGNLSTEQQHLIESIHYQSRVLTKLLNSLFLLTRIEDGLFQEKSGDVHLAQMVRERVQEWEQLQGQTADNQLPDHMTIHGDTTLIQAAIDNIFSVFLQSSQADVDLEIQPVEIGENLQAMSISGHLDFPLLQYAQTIQLEEADRSLVGGVQGLLLSVANSLIEAAGGTLSMEEVGAQDQYYVVTIGFPV